MFLIQFKLDKSDLIESRGSSNPSHNINKTLYFAYAFIQFKIQVSL